MSGYAQEERNSNAAYGAPTETDTASQDELDLTSLENDATDTLDRQMLQHARDQQRLQALSRDGSGARLQAFRKARPGTRVGLTLENLERQNGQAGSNGRLGSPESVSSSERSDPPVQGIPREWGRKGRKNNDWLRKIPVKGGEEWHEEPEVTHPAGPSHRQGEDTRNVDWSAAAAADVPLPSVEDSPEAYRRHVSPANSSLENIRQWELSEDLSLGSVLASTPAAYTRNTALDEIRQRELESLKTRRITSNELASIREKSPFQSPSQRPASRSSLRPRSRQEDFIRDDAPITSGINRPVNNNIEEDSISQSWIHTDEQDIVLPKQRRKLRSPIKSIKLPSLIRKVSNPGADQESPQSPPAVNISTAQGQTSPQRPSHKRQDSQDLLRRLARAASGTPSPQLTRQRPTIERPKSPSKMSKIPTFSKKLGGEELRPGRALERPSSPLEREKGESSIESVTKRSDTGKRVTLGLPQVNNERSKSPINVNSPKRTSLIPSLDRKDFTVDRRYGRLSHIPQRVSEETVAVEVRKQIVEEYCETVVGPSSPSRTPNAAKTPMVTAGGWVDTPATAMQKKPLPLWANNSRLGSRSRSRSPKKGDSRPSSPDKPASRPSSPSKLSQATDQFVEPTLKPVTESHQQSLQSVKPLLPKSALSAVLAQEPSSDDHYGDSTIESLEDLAHTDSAEPTATLDLELPAEEPRTETERKRFEEIKQLQMMNQSLKATRTSIRDTSRGLKNLGQAVLDSDKLPHDSENDDVALVARTNSRRSSVNVLVMDKEDDGVQCMHCGCPGGFYSRPFSALWTAFKSFFVQREGRILRFTWLSLFLIALLSWVLTETVLWYVVPAFTLILFALHVAQDESIGEACMECGKVSVSPALNKG